jgi:hypothetical protein
MDSLTDDKVHPGSKMTGQNTMTPVSRAISPEPGPVPGMKRLQAEAHESEGEGEGEDEVEKSDGGDSTKEDDHEESDAESGDGSDGDETEATPIRRPFRLLPAPDPSWAEIANQHFTEVAKINRELDRFTEGTEAVSNAVLVGQNGHRRSQQLGWGMDRMTALTEQAKVELEQSRISALALGQLTNLLSQYQSNVVGKPSFGNPWTERVGPLPTDSWCEFQGIQNDPTVQDELRREVQEKLSSFPCAPSEEPSRVLHNSLIKIKSTLQSCNYKMPILQENGRKFRPDYSQWTTRADDGSVVQYFPHIYPTLNRYRSMFVGNYPERKQPPRTELPIVSQPGVLNYNPREYSSPPTQTSFYSPTSYPASSRASSVGGDTASEYTYSPRAPHRRSVLSFARS